MQTVLTPPSETVNDRGATARRAPGRPGYGRVVDHRAHGAGPRRPVAVRVCALLGGLLILTGCGAAPPATLVVATRSPAPPQPAASLTPRAEILVAVLERRGGASAPNLVAIVGLDGRARARASFAERAVPTAGALTAVLQPEARVVGGAVYYTDGLGVVRRLTPRGGDPATVATFPITSDQQAVAVVVSPDAARLVATVLSVQPWHVDVEVASAGGPTVTVRSIDVPATEPGTAPRLLQVAGWDASGPVALADGLAAQAQDDGGGLWQGHPAHLDGHGLAGPPLGGPACGASFEEPDGTLLCHDAIGATTTLRRPDGSAVHAFTHTGGGPRLSPDGRRLAYSVGGGRSAVQSWDGSTVALAAGFTPSGWLAPDLLIGNTRGEELAYVDLGAPGRAVDMGFPGAFVGVVQG